MERYLELLPSFLEDPSKDKGESKLKVIQEITEGFETILASPAYPQFLEAAIPIFLKFFEDGEPHFVAEYQLQQARKAVLELLHRLPANEVLRPYVRPILTAVFKLLGIDNEENVLICLRIIIELHKQFRPQFSSEVQNFLVFVRSVYKDLPRHMEKIFEPKSQVKVKDLSEINLSSSPALDDIYSVTNFQSDKKTAEGTTQSYTVLPKARNSLKVLQELPIIVVLMYQIYKTSVQQEVADFIPIVMSTITLQPNENHRTSTGFNKEVLVEFMGAQVKTLSFLAYIIKLYQDLVIQHSELLVNGLINLLTLCPMEVAQLRRELFIAARHIMATELRYKFVPHMDKLFDEDILLGKGWTVNETMRPLAYSTLADLVHHVRQHLSLSHLSKAVTFFSYHVHDETLPVSIHTMSCKLLFNLVESIRVKSDLENGDGRVILMKMLDVLAYKFKIIAQIHIPYFTGKFNLAAAQSEKKVDAEQTVEEILSRGFASVEGTPKEDGRRFGFPHMPMQAYVFHECRTLVKTIVCAVKTISWGIASCKARSSQVDASGAASKQFTAKETEVYLRLMKWGLKAVEIYAINSPVTGVNGQTIFMPQRSINTQGVRSKEEKEVMEHFAGAFTLLNTYTFRELFTVRIRLLVERIHENNALQVVANNLLANPTTSAVFATILVEFLLEKLPDMGEDADKSSLYLRLFKLVFGSVSLFPAENEQMLKPHLREIVNRSMELALNAKDPYNYFLLLRALFRSIGGGSHDLLYQEFLPLLPSLLQGLNNLQSGLHKQHMKDLFVELCLTVPVRLSSLLPYLPMLMDPLVSALNGSSTLVSQGLRTLELCVDNLQPEFLYEHIQPVRADLMKALWRTLRNPTETTATVAYRILGKFGGSNRKMLVEPQKLEYGDKTNQGPQVQLFFQDHKAAVTLPIEKAIETAYEVLKTPNVELHYKKHAWQLLKSYLVASMVTNEDRSIVTKGMLHSSLHHQEITNVPVYKYSDDKARQIHTTAISGVFIATTTKELKQEVYSFLISLMRHYGMIAVAQQLGPFLSNKYHGIDPYVVFDAATMVLAGEEKDFERSVFFALSVLMNVLINMVGTKERACSLQMMEYLSDKVCSLCYERAWYTKMGGCNAIDFLVDHMSSKWILSRYLNILKAMLFILTDLSGEVSSGAVEAAKNNLDKILRICVAINEVHLEPLRESSLAGVTIELVRHLTSSVANVREQSMKNLKLMAELQGKTVSDVIQPHLAVIADMIPPKKHLIRHQSLQSQLGILDGNSFCLSLVPKLFSIDFTLPEHRSFIPEIVGLCESDDATLSKLPCYKGVLNLLPVRTAILKVLGCVVVPSPLKEKIISLFLLALANSNEELQLAAFESMGKFMRDNEVELDLVNHALRPVVLSLANQKSVTLEGLRHAAFLYQLSPDGNIKLWDTLIQVLRKFLEGALQNHSKTPNKNGFHEFKIAVAILDHFELLTNSSDPQQLKFLESVCKLCLQAEKALSLGKGSPLRPNLMKYLLKLPLEYINQVFTTYLPQPEWNGFFLYFLQQPNAGALRETLLQNSALIVHSLSIRQNPINPSTAVSYTEKELAEIQFFGVKCTYVLSRFYEESILNDVGIFHSLKILWEIPNYQQGIQFNHWEVDVQTWKEPLYVSKILLMYYKKNQDDIDLLFLLLLAFCGKPVSQYQFLKEYLEVVTVEFSVARKRKIFLRFVDVFGDEKYSSDLKAKIIQFLLIPCMTHCFEHGLGDEFVGSPPLPDVDSPDNIVSVLLSKVIDAENPNAQGDNVRIILCQLSCLMVEVAAAHIHDASNKKQGNKLRRLMTFAWPCLLSKACVDSSTKYYGHLLLSHIIAKFAIHKRIVLQVFHSLLKASVMEAKGVIKQALEIITPALPLRMEDGNTMLIHWTKKILVEEGHSLAQLTHILQLIVRHWRVYFPVRFLLINHIINAIQRLGFTPSSTFEHRRLAVELSEVIIKWELERIKLEGEEEVKSDALSPAKADNGKNLERSHTDAVVNFLLRMACQVNDSAPTPGSPGELLSRRCVALLKTVLKPHIWLNCDLKLAWFDKLFLTLEGPQANFQNICTALDLLTFITGILSKEQVLEQFKGLQKGIAACMVSQNSKVIRAVHNLMTKLMGIYPTDYPGGSSTMAKCEEFDHLYGNVSKLVFDALVNYEKLTAPNPSVLMGPLMMLKSACTANPCYIDRIITAFMKVLQKLSKEHLTPGNLDTQVGTDLLILSMDLVKNRVGVMGVEMRKAFIGTVLVSLIEKTSDSKVMQGIVKMLEEWVKNKSPIVINQGPSSREKSILLVKMMQNAEKRFPNDQELVGQFLELVNFIYRDDQLKGTELNAKLEFAFLSGLRCTQSSIRKKFFEVFDSSIRKRLHDRLMYVMCSQNWEAMGPHYWIKQCIELLFNTVADVDMQITPPEMMMPGIAHGFHFLDAISKEFFLNSPDIKDEPMETQSEFIQDSENDLVLLQATLDPDAQELLDLLTRIEEQFLKSWVDPPAPLQNVKTFLIKDSEFTNSVKRVKLSTFVTSLIQLCHYETNLAESVWTTFFPRAWKIFSEKQQMALANEMVPFLCSGVHVVQKDCVPSALNTFAEAVCQCVPSVPMKPIVLYYLGRNHNLWHRSCLVLEQYVFDGNAQQLKAKKEQGDCYEFEPTTSTSPRNLPAQNLEVMDALSDLYTSLREEDLWQGLWQRRAKYTETNVGIALMNQGYYEKAQGVFELAMTKAKEDFEEEFCPSSIFPECRLWEEQWIKCAKELNQWNIVQEYTAGPDGKNPVLELDAIWRQGNWSAVKDLLGQVETACPREFAWKIHLYRGYHAICSPDEQNLPVVDRYVDTANQICIKDWRRLPHLVSTAHVPILQAAQQIVELHEAASGIHLGYIQGRVNTVHDMKAVVKTWRNRLPCISDDLSHWGDIFTWRQQHYTFISSQFDSVPPSSEAGAGSGSQGMLGIHASAQAICHFGKIARKQNLHSVALDSLSKIYTIPSVPIVDCFQKIKQQVKCYILQAQILGRNELQDALEIVESTNLKYFSKEMTSEFFTLKACLLGLIGRSDEANKCFSASCQLNDNLTKCWGFWGDYLEAFYVRDPTRNVNMGISAMTAYMQACRNQGEIKSRKYIAKILWLLTYDDEKGTYADIVDKYSAYVPPIQWLPWVPQLLTLLVRHDGKMVINLLNAVGRMYPQAVYFPIRTLYLTLKIEQREKVRSAELAVAASAASTSQAAAEGNYDPESSGGAKTTSTQPGEGQAIKATPSMWRCSRIMHMQRDLHPTVLSSLEGIVDQIVWFRENWYEEVLRQLKIGLAKCYAIAFENRASVAEASITPQLQNFVRKLVSTFGHAGIGAATGSGSSTIEALLRRSTIQDPAVQQMKLKFTADFDTSAPTAVKLHNLIISLRKWIKILEVKTKLYSKSFLMEDRFRFLQNFSTQMAEIELPGEFLIPKHAHYYVKIARFQPRVEVVQKHNTSARRIFIRGHNGKIYPYLIVNDSGLTDARREERVMQMLRMMNHYLSRQKVTSKRNLNFTVPKVVAVSPQMRLVEDNPSSLSLLDVFKHSCSKRGVEFDAAITRYYDKIAGIQTRGAQVSHQVLREILRDIQANIVPRTMMKEWALNTFITPSDYWMFRKTFTLQLALADFAEYSFHLTRLNPEMMYLHQDSGLLNISYFKFELDDVTGELESNRPVPFRLTPNISEFMTPFGVSGPIVSSMISLARCLVYPNYKVQAILRAILRDEVIAWLQKKQSDREILNAVSGSRESLSNETDAEAVINRVTKSAASMMNRLQVLSAFDGSESKVNTLVAAANSHDNLCRMDPAWHPWL